MDRYVHMNERIGDRIIGSWHRANEQDGPKCGYEPMFQHGEPQYRSEDYQPQVFCKHCANGWWVRVKSTGQPRPYADSVYTIQVRPLNGQSREDVYAFCQTWRKGAPSFEQAGFLQPYVRTFGVDANGLYTYTVIEPFCD